MVDLAGADFDDRDLGSSTSSTTAQQRKESIDINKSLLALKECFRYDDNENIQNKSRSGSDDTFVHKSRNSSGVLGQRGRRLQELVSEAAS